MNVNGVHIGSMALLGLLNFGLALTIGHANTLSIVFAIFIGVSTFLAGRFGGYLQNMGRIEQWFSLCNHQLDRIEGMLKHQLDGRHQ